MASGHPVKVFRLSKKCKDAIRLLCQEGVSDLDESILEKLVKKGKLDYQRLYTGCEDIGYRWDEKHHYWKRNIPAWLEMIIRAEIKKLRYREE